MLDFDGLGISFDEIEKASEGNFELLPEGEYWVKVVNVSVKQTAEFKLHGLNFEFSILEPTQYANKKIFKMFCLESKDGTKQKTLTMLGIFSGFLSKCGITKEERKLLLDDGYKPNSLHVALSDRHYLINVKQILSKKNGKVYNNFDTVKSFKEAGASF